ncbi:hypothetical protein [Thiorhodococcus fuscus]|uniref:DUF8082 domain-containing protein n=1 Tax=Thiorhodococcus fuscus TaxID=527200 RepID=A0ABW4Y4D7_9GAMM
MADGYIIFAKIVEEIRRLVSQQVTGTLFIATNENRSAQVSIEAGKIVYLYFSNTVGVTALERMAQIHSGRYRFQEGPAGLPRVDLPPTETILAALEAAASRGDASGPREGAEASGLTEPQKTVLVECLVEFIGPIAEILSEDHLRQASDLNTTIDALAGEIPSPDQATQFRALVRAKLRA